DQQFQRRRSPTCGTKKFKATISSRCLIYAYFRFWVFYDCTFLDNSNFCPDWLSFILAYIVWGYDLQYLLTGLFNQHPRTAIQYTKDKRRDVSEFYKEIISQE
ncbi:MAG: hypothetical protein SPK89_00070, partial [Ruminococcus flavefaciens]|nr:hypothetical protein [Ruminococcus flavefaciens]MDY5690038.1 hypothetical protein [Ruminococcus flavefaciens]